MPEKISKEARSHIMSSIRSKNTKVERMLREFLRGTYIRYQPNVYGRPDFGAKRKKIAVFIDGCFWHGCPKCYVEPKSRQEFWRRKIERNVARDNEVTKKLRNDGWQVLRFWEHQMLENPAKVTSQIRAAMKRAKASIGQFSKIREDLERG